MSSRAIRSFDVVTADAYLDLANELSLSLGAASRRSAVDRAYYAAVLAVRDELADKHYISVVENSQAHTQVANALKHISEDASERLIALRRARNRLTYRTESIYLPRRQSLQSLLESARAVIEAVQALPRNLP
jgi:hypothetical protein